MTKARWSSLIHLTMVHLGKLGHPDIRTDIAAAWTAQILISYWAIEW